MWSVRNTIMITYKSGIAIRCHVCKLRFKNVSCLNLLISLHQSTVDWATSPLELFFIVLPAICSSFFLAVLSCECRYFVKLSWRSWNQLPIEGITKWLMFGSSCLSMPMVVPLHALFLPLLMLPFAVMPEKISSGNNSSLHHIWGQLSESQVIFNPSYEVCQNLQSASPSPV